MCVVAAAVKVDVVKFKMAAAAAAAAAAGLLSSVHLLRRPPTAL